MLRVEERKEKKKEEDDLVSDPPACHPHSCLEVSLCHHLLQQVADLLLLRGELNRHLQLLSRIRHAH